MIITVKLSQTAILQDFKVRGNPWTDSQFVADRFGVTRRFASKTLTELVYRGLLSKRRITSLKKTEIVQYRIPLDSDIMNMALDRLEEIAAKYPNYKIQFETVISELESLQDDIRLEEELK